MPRYVVLSCTDDPLYLFYLPIVAQAWHELGFGTVLCVRDEYPSESFRCALSRCNDVNFMTVTATDEQLVTYIQCSRLFAACGFIDPDVVLITSDVDMLPIHRDYFNHPTDSMHVYGADLVQDNQYPICYISGTVNQWKAAFNISEHDSVTRLINREIGHVQCEDMRGNYWFRDQETARKYLGENVTKIPRRLSSGKASGRLERDEWRIKPGTIDAHLPRPGFEGNNLMQIERLLNQAFPGKFGWVREYHKQFIELL